MAQIAQFIPHILTGAGIIGGAIKGQEKVDPRPLPPIWPDLNFGMGRFLSNQFRTGPSGEPTLWGVQPYPGQLSPNINQTRLPEVYGNWQPYNSGNTYMMDILHNRNPYGTPDPRLANIMQWGGTGGPGNQSMSLAMQFGAPSQAGQYMGNMAQFGVPTQAMGNLMNPFLSGQGGPKYLPPPIVQRQVRRNA